ncbi:putative RNA-binding protein Luc7-like 2 isoform X2 [Folsomia candida]|uniref:putative RNA-binding protein Luc7-like 2 isoform X2 n=1 Tax=Folsomia candida TaxID=158441 RepID=UPI001604B003|nr:putative RNA-binding protein Luc7-like 2 isoform X2 [Folsomia candida]
MLPPRCFSLHGESNLLLFGRSQSRIMLEKCTRVHNVGLKADYELTVASGKRYCYDLEVIKQLAPFVAKADRRVAEARERLKANDDVTTLGAKVSELGEKIDAALKKAEQLGATGFVAEGMKVVGGIDAMLKEKGEAERVYFAATATVATAGMSSQRKNFNENFRVCEVCSVYVGIHDTEQRKRDHLEGKLHQGFIKIRETLKELERVDAQRRKVRREQIRLDDKIRRLREQERREEERWRMQRWNPPMSRRAKREEQRRARRDEERDRSRRRHDHSQFRSRSRSGHRNDTRPRSRERGDRDKVTRRRH